MPRLSLSPLLAAALLAPTFATKAFAEDGEEPAVYAQRDIILQKDLIRPEAMLGFSKFAGVDDLYIQVFGSAAWSPATNLQVGALAVPLTISPDTEYGDPRLYARYRVLDGDIQLAPELGFTFNGANILDLGLQTQFTLNKASFVRVAPTLTIDFEADAKRFGLEVPVELAISASRQIYGAFRTGLYVPQFDFDIASIPLGVEVGYSFAKNDVAWFDLYAQFTLPALITPTADEMFHADTFMIGLGGRIHLASK
jgi:hypothetical protein